ncbi:MAG: hypothetical protein MRZ79_01520 [Bacteroidia bacterium]|nr:hypothetical protein [Bacteroidia bacterium]
MDFVAELEKLEDLFYGEWEENKEPLIAKLKEIHSVVGEDKDQFNRFLVQTAERFGGTYIPYLFWDKLSYFFDTPEERIYLQELLRAFSISDFEDVEQKLMKPLLVTYFSKEKDFELNKLKAKVIEKAHPEVKEYFVKLMNFVEKNAKATGMYAEKFDMLKAYHPDFELLNLPITQLREKLKGNQN